jgi:hypothetical protein
MGRPRRMSKLLLAIGVTVLASLAIQAWRLRALSAQIAPVRTELVGLWHAPIGTSRHRYLLLRPDGTGLLSARPLQLASTSGRRVKWELRAADSLQFEFHGIDSSYAVEAEMKLRRSRDGTRMTLYPPLMSESMAVEFIRLESGTETHR